MTKRILIADDHSIVRSGIKLLINEHLHMQQVEEAADDNEIIQKTKAGNFDLILLDIDMPGSDFINMMDWLKNTTPDTAILIFTMHAEEIYGNRCLQLGAKGFLHKTASNTEILKAINTVLEGGVYINSKLRVLLAQPANISKKTNPFDQLSSRELETALLISKGLRLPEICSVLNIQYSTANTFKRRIFEKLKVHNAVSLSHLMQAFEVK